ncbi:hypothetical protein FRC12_012635 [Ceratobasidium sp. 428]|nr:hypothetical protein FRC12_012635 [Ceratobasidium sp. 428]
MSMRKKRDNNRDRVVCVETQLRCHSRWFNAAKCERDYPEPFAFLPRRHSSSSTAPASAFRDGGGSALSNPRMSFYRPLTDNLIFAAQVDFDARHRGLCSYI